MPADEFTSRFGFYCPIEKSSSGLSAMAVRSEVDFIHLEGSISVQEVEIQKQAKLWLDGHLHEFVRLFFRNLKLSLIS
ncbi:MAG: hypothetical protein GZ094_23225 [Mariniphaga sp.]|nr:hypothetical protein [Mariniphaga sp.]